MADLPIAPVKRIIKEAGAKRVSHEAATELKDELEDYAEERAREAKEFASHAGRKTVQAEDIRASQ